MTYAAKIAAATGGETIDLAGATIPRLDIRGRVFADPVTIRNGTVGALQVSDCAGLIFDSLTLHYDFQADDRIALTPFLFDRCTDCALTNSTVSGSRGSGTLPNGRKVANIWWGQGPFFRSCLRPRIEGCEISSIWQGVQFLNCDDTRTIGNHVHSHGDDALRLMGGTGHLVEGNRFVDGDTADRDHALAFHPDAIQMYQAWDTGQPARNVTLRRNILSSLPTAPNVDDANAIYAHVRPDARTERMVVAENLFIAGGGMALAIERPLGCVVRNNTVIDRDGVGVLPMLQLRARGLTDCDSVIEGNVVPRQSWQPDGEGITQRDNIIVTRDQYPGALVMDGPFETWRAVPGSPFDGVGSPLLWPDAAPAVPDLSADLARVTAERDRLQAMIDAARAALT